MLHQQPTSKVDSPAARSTVDSRCRMAKSNWLHLSTMGMERRLYCHCSTMERWLLEFRKSSSSSSSEPCGARRCSTRVSTLRAEDRGILNNRRIDRYCVSSIEYPQQQILVIGSTAGRQQGQAARKHQVSMREQSKGKRPDNQQGQAARKQQVSMREQREQEARTDIARGDREKKSTESWNRNGERPEE